MFKQEKCVPCQGGIPPMSEQEIVTNKKFISKDWDVIDGIKLTKEFQFGEYKDAIDFTNSIANLAEEQGHHPYIHINFRKVKIIIFTHKINGLHKNDFLMAKKIDNIK